MINIIGGSGFIGTKLADLLDISKIDFKILDIKISDKYPNKSTLCDVTNLNELVSSIDRGSIIINLAAEHKDNVIPISRYYDVNVNGAANLCKACELKDVKDIIFTSTVAVYGFAEEDTDENGVVNPFNDYGKSKYLSEQEYNKWFENSSQKGKSLTIIRPTVVFGENNRGNVYNLFNQIVNGPFLMIGDGKNKKSLAYVDNLASFILYCINNPPLKISIYNYADKPDLTVNELISIICDSIELKPYSKVRVPFPIAYCLAAIYEIIHKIINRESSISRIRVKKFCANSTYKSRVSDTNFLPPFSLKQAIHKTIRFEFF